MSPKCRPRVLHGWKHNKNQWFFIHFQNCQDSAREAHVSPGDPQDLPQTCREAPRDSHGASKDVPRRPPRIPQDPKDTPGHPQGDQRTTLESFRKFCESFIAFSDTEAPMDDPTLCSTFWGAPGAFKDTSRSAQRQPKSTKERPRTLNDSHRAPNNHQDHTRHAQVSPKGASIVGNTTKTNGF